MRLKHEPASEPLHESWRFNVRVLSNGVHILAQRVVFYYGHRLNGLDGVRIGACWHFSARTLPQFYSPNAHAGVSVPGSLFRVLEVGFQVLGLAEHVGFGSEPPRRVADFFLCFQV